MEREAHLPIWQNINQGGIPAASMVRRTVGAAGCFFAIFWRSDNAEFIKGKESFRCCETYKKRVALQKKCDIVCTEIDKEEERVWVNSRFVRSALSREFWPCF